MSCFADSSAVVTRYAAMEAPVLPDDGSIVVSAIARVEVPSAFWGKSRSGHLTSSDAAVLVAAFEADWRASRYIRLGLGVDVLADAAVLTGRHGLRSLDAVQLATAVLARRADPACGRFVTLDRKLADAAAVEGFMVLPSSPV